MNILHSWRPFKRPQPNALLRLGLILFLAHGAALRAQDTTYTDGENNPGTLVTPDNITLSITAGASATQSGAISGTGSITVNSDPVNTGTLTFTGTNTYTGDTQVAYGALVVSGTGGAILNGTDESLPLPPPFSPGVFVIVTATSTFTIGETNTVVPVPASVTISNGGSVVTGTGIIAQAFDPNSDPLGLNSLMLNGDILSSLSSLTLSGAGSLTVDGAGSKWTSHSLTVGSINGLGSLTISNGGTVSDFIAEIGTGVGIGSVTVTGSNSVWNNLELLQGEGVVKISDGGQVNATEGVISAGFFTFFELDSGGVLTTKQFAGGGFTLLVFDGGILRANADNNDFAGAAGIGIVSTGTFDNNGHNIGIITAISGSGTAVFTGAGTTTLTATNTYSGDTIVNLGTLAISGTGAISNTANVYVGLNDGDNGAMLISSGGQVTGTAGFIGYNSGSTGAVTVDGAGSLWTNGKLYVGVAGTGTLTISNGGQVTGTAGFIGFDSGSTGTVAVDGAGSLWSTGSGELRVGDGGAGALTITNGGQVLNGNGIVGSLAGSTGTVTVDGAGSTWTNNVLYVGAGGSGTLTISNGGLVIAGTQTNVTLTSAAQGVVNLDSGGILQTASVANGGGSSGAHLNFDGGILRATADSGDFITGFTGTEVALQSGGGTIDNNGYAITINAPITGTGGLTLTGTNVTTLTAANSYTGGTVVNGGTLALSGAGSLASTGAVQANGTFDLSQTAAGAAVGDLSGSGTVNLGSQTLTAGASGSTAFGGLIQDGGIGGGTGGCLAKVGSGTLALTSANTYTGGTVVQAGTLKVNNAAGSATGSGAVDVKSGATIGGGNGAEFSGTLATIGTGLHAPSLSVYSPSTVGMISGPLTIESGAHLAPGNSVGTLTVASLTLDSGALLDYEFNATANDFTEVTTPGGLVLEGGAFNLYQENTTTPFYTHGTYDLIGYTGTFTGSIASLSVANAQAGYSYVFFNDTVDDVIQVQIVPEPADWQYLLLGLLCLFFFSRRLRSRKSLRCL